MSEQQIQTKIIAFLETNGWDYVKTIRLSKAGYPDILAMKEGKSIWLECKASAKEKASPLQLRRISDLRKNGFIAEVVWSIDQVSDIISNLK